METSSEHPRTAVVIDDSALVRELVCDVLDANGWTCFSAADGEAGIAAVQEHDPDVVMCDLHMPGMDGLEVIRRLAAVRQKVPVVILSRDDDLVAVRTAIRAGAHDYVIKTGDEEAIVKAANHAARHFDAMRGRPLTSR